MRPLMTCVQHSVVDCYAGAGGQLQGAVVLDHIQDTVARPIGIFSKPLHCAGAGGCGVARPNLADRFGLLISCAFFTACRSTEFPATMMAHRLTRHLSHPQVCGVSLHWAVMLAWVAIGGAAPRTMQRFLDR